MDSPQFNIASFESTPNIMYELGSIKSELKAINEKLDTKEAAQDIKISSLEKEISKLKEWRTYQMGAAAVLATIISLTSRIIPWQNFFS